MAGVALASLLLCVGNVCKAQAPVTGVEYIGPITLAINQPIDLWFANVFCPNCPKVLTFTGSASPIPGMTAAGILEIQFDWLNPAGGTDYSPVFSQSITGPTQLDLSYTIPYCPERVSIHFNIPTTSDSRALQVEGTFTHDCKTPDPANVGAVVGIVFLGLAAMRRRLIKV